MADYISRDFVLELAREYYTPDLREIVEAAPLKAIMNIPTADVAPVRHGKWELKGGNERKHMYECSNCQKAIYCDKFIEDTISVFYKYCPECGSRMDGRT